jgi:hypothetical protein
VCKLLLDGLLFALPKNTSGFTSVSPSCSAAIGYRQTVNYLLQDNYLFDSTSQFKAFLRCGLFAPSHESFAWRSFTTATRNYAKLQLHWYHSQCSFLWLHPRRPPGGHSDGNDGVTKELVHWMNVPREEYEEMIRQQVINSRFSRLLIVSEVQQAKRCEEEIKTMGKKGE